MKRHFNLYYLLFEDYIKRQMSREARERMWKNLTSILRRKPMAKLTEQNEEK